MVKSKLIYDFIQQEIEKYGTDYKEKVHDDETLKAASRKFKITKDKILELYCQYMNSINSETKINLNEIKKMQKIKKEVNFLEKFTQNLKEIKKNGIKNGELHNKKVKLTGKIAIKNNPVKSRFINNNSNGLIFIAKQSDYVGWYTLEGKTKFKSEEEIKLFFSDEELEEVEE